MKESLLQNSPGEQRDLIEESSDIIESIQYIEDQSPDFDALLHSGRKISTARRDGLSEITKEGILFSDWHVPCHCIIVRAKNGDCQAFHIQPNKMSASLLTWEQEKALKGYKDSDAKYIVAKGLRSWFGLADSSELEEMNITEEKVVNVDTSNGWRLIYDVEKNELWIDIKDKKLLLKSKGFNLKPIQS
jgi:hypothetical protein